MQKSPLCIALKILGVIIMLFTFLIFPDDAPWYYELLAFNLGLLIAYTPNLMKFFASRKA